MAACNLTMAAPLGTCAWSNVTRIITGDTRSFNEQRMQRRPDYSSYMKSILFKATRPNNPNASVAATKYNRQTRNAKNNLMAEKIGKQLGFSRDRNYMAIYELNRESADKIYSLRTKPDENQNKVRNIFVTYVPGETVDNMKLYDFIDLLLENKLTLESRTLPIMKLQFILNAAAAPGKINFTLSQLILLMFLCDAPVDIFDYSCNVYENEPLPGSRPSFTRTISKGKGRTYKLKRVKRNRT